MNLRELCDWLRTNSSGIYRPAAEAAERIEDLANALATVMDGMKDHDVTDETGIDGPELEWLLRVRAEARELCAPEPTP